MTPCNGRAWCEIVNACSRLGINFSTVIFVLMALCLVVGGST